MSLSTIRRYSRTLLDHFFQLQLCFSLALALAIFSAEPSPCTAVRAGSDIYLVGYATTDVSTNPYSHCYELRKAFSTCVVSEWTFSRTASGAKGAAERYPVGSYFCDVVHAEQDGSEKFNTVSMPVVSFFLPSDAVVGTEYEIEWSGKAYEVRAAFVHNTGLKCAQALGKRTLE